MSIEKLEVTFIRVKLDDSSGGMLSDPANYLKMTCGSQEYKSSTVYGKGKNPKWDDKIEIENLNAPHMNVEVWNEGTFSDDKLACCKVMLDQLKT